MQSVCKGHPDKLCDLILDSILDACLRKDKSFSCCLRGDGYQRTHHLFPVRLPAQRELISEVLSAVFLPDVGYNPQESF